MCLLIKQYDKIQPWVGSEIGYNKMWWGSKYNELVILHLLGAMFPYTIFIFRFIFQRKIWARDTKPPGGFACQTLSVTNSTRQWVKFAGGPGMAAIRESVLATQGTLSTTQRLICVDQVCLFASDCFIRVYHWENSKIILSISTLY